MEANEQEFGYGDAVCCNNSVFGFITALSQYRNSAGKIWYEVNTIEGAYNILAVFPVEKIQPRRRVLIEKTKSIQGSAGNIVTGQIYT